MSQAPSRRVSSLQRARFIGLSSVCDCVENSSRAGRRYTSPALRRFTGGFQNPDVAVVPVRSSVGEPPDRDNGGPAPARSSFRFPRERARRCHSGLRFDSVLPIRPVYRDKIVQRQNRAETKCRQIRNRRGEGFCIARRFISAVCLLVYKVKQFEGNYLQNVATREPPDKSLAYGERRNLSPL